MDRRNFLALSGAGLVAVGTGVSLAGCQPLQAADANGIKLPAGFTSRVIATTNQVVPGTSYTWHTNPDGGACFPVSGGGWIYVSNSESIAGGASMVQFAADGTVVHADRILEGTLINCAGGAMPWGTWLSCEEYDLGTVWECDPTGVADAIDRPGLGVFSHEAAAADPVGQAIYLTEDKSNGCLYRFRPDTWGDLSAGVLEVLTEDGGTLGWATVPDPTAGSGTLRTQVATAKHFAGGEGAAYEGGHIFFTTKGDNRVWRYTPATNVLTIVYDANNPAGGILTGVDNITTRGEDLYVAEDGGNMEIVRIRPNGNRWPFMELTGVASSEIAGPAFSPDGTRLYFSSQRNPGRTYEISGTF